MILTKKTAWLALISLSIFDNCLSYYAITKLNAHEANLVIAPIVESYPLIYFLCIPLTILILYLTLLLFKKLFSRAFTFYKIREESLQTRIILTAFVIYWVIGNSLMNFLFLIGIRLPGLVWGLFSALAVTFALAYSFSQIRQHKI